MEEIVLVGLFLMLSISITLLAAPITAQEATLVVENGRVVVGDGTVLERGSVVISEDRVLSVGEEQVAAPGARRIDASGRTVLPGLIDTHVHLLVERMTSQPWSDAELQVFVQEGLPSRLRAFLESGITTVMSTGDFWPAVREVREKVRSGELPGPRIFTAGPVFTAPGGHPAAGPVCGPWGERDANPWCREHMAVAVDDREQARDAVARLARQGVDHVKMVYDSIGPPGVEQLKADRVGEIVRTAHDHGLRAYGHVFGIPNAIQALEKGLDGFAHLPAYPAQSGDRDRLVQLMRTEAVTASTTLVSTDALIADLKRAGNDGLLRHVTRQMELIRRTFAALAEADDRLIALGTDTPQLPPGDAYRREIRLAADAGLAPEETIRAATRNAAAHLGRLDELGTLEPGKLADLIIVDRDPLEDLSALQNVELVVKGGKVVVEH